jgi:hypothetical protein
MFKKTITYLDYNGLEIKEDFYFNLTKAEIMEMQLQKSGGFAEKIQKVVDAKDVPELVSIFKELILKSYGVKSDDGKRFIKTDKVREEFTQTEAYSDLYVELATNADSASAFVNGIIPADQLKAIQEKK